MSQKEESLRYTGSMQQLAYVRALTYEEGRARGMAAYELKNGPLSLRIAADKCLDVTELSYKGLQINFLAKPGLEGRNAWDTHGAEAQHSIMGGLFFTCGLENICAPCTLDGHDYPMHGRMRTTPAEHVSADARWEGDDYVLRVSGEMREAELFGENLTLRREIVTKLGEKSLTVRDTLCNEGFREEPALLLYHCNMGYPFLTEESRLYAPTDGAKGRDPWAAQHEDRWNLMEPPAANEPEYVFTHHLRGDAEGYTMVLSENPRLKLGLCLRYKQDTLPNFMQWKSVAAGDYVLGLEPTNACPLGRPMEAPPTLKPLEEKHTELTFTVLEGEEELERCKRAIEKM